MSVQLSVAIRNARLDVFEQQIGTVPLLKIYTGAQPANCAASISGTLLSTITLPSDWMSAAASGVKSLLGTWTDNSADAADTAGHFRIYDSSDTDCGMQGSITVTGGGGDMTIDDIVFVIGKQFTVNTFTLTDANA